MKVFVFSLPYEFLSLTLYMKLSDRRQTNLLRYHRQHEAIIIYLFRATRISELHSLQSLGCCW